MTDVSTAQGLQTPPSLSDHERDVLRRVARKQPLNKGDHAEVLRLTRLGLMTVTPTYTVGEVCPYLLTDAGKAVRA